MSLTRDISDILAECLDAIDAGEATVDACLEKYPEQRDELAILLSTRDVLHAVAQSKPVQPSAEFRAGARASLLSKLEPRQAPTTGRPVPVIKRPWWHRLRSGYARMAIIALLVFILLGSVTGGTIYASERALPGATLYSLKTGIEQYRLSRADTDNDVIVLQLEFANRRVDEMAQLVELGEETLIASTSKAYATLLQDATERVEGIDLTATREALTSSLEQTIDFHQSRLLEMDALIDTLREQGEFADEGDLLFASANDAIGSAQTYVDTGIYFDVSVEPMSIYETLLEHEEYAAFIALLDESELQMLLTENGPFTLFVPLDSIDAFTSMEDVKLRRQRVLYHIGRGSLSSAQLMTTDDLLMALGNNMMISVIDDELILNGSVRVVARDIEATNGTIHFIDLPLTPPNYFP